MTCVVTDRILLQFEQRN